MKRERDEGNVIGATRESLQSNTGAEDQKIRTMCHLTDGMPQYMWSKLYRLSTSSRDNIQGWNTLITDVSADILSMLGVA